MKTRKILFFSLCCWLLSTLPAFSQWNREKLSRFEEQVKTYEAIDPATLPGAGAVVLTGSSSFRGWQTAHADLAPLPILNRAIGGSTLPEILHYAERLVVRYQPSVVAIYCGENDLADMWDAEFAQRNEQAIIEEWQKNFTALMEKLHQQLPNSSVFFVTVKYSESRRHLWSMVTKVNQFAQAYAAQRPWCHYTDANRAILRPGGEAMAGIFQSDNLHFNEEGYRRWSQPIREALTPEWFRLQARRIAPENQWVPATAWADPMIGVDDDGRTLPGVSLPFSMLRLSPDGPIPNATNGYRTYKPIIGFSHTHVSGTGGGGRYGNLLIGPMTSAPEKPEAVPSTGKADEYARTGLYSVRLLYGNTEVRCELTGTDRAGLHRYTFPKPRRSETQPHLLVDVSRVIQRELPEGRDPRCLDAQVTVLNDSTLEGFGHFTGGWGPARPYHVYFSIRTSEPFQAKLAQKGEWKADSATVSGNKIAALLAFPQLVGKSVEMRVGISFTSVENARTNRTTLQGRTFHQVRFNAQQTWDNWMNRIRVKGGTDEQRTLFYTMMYKMAVMPTDVTNENRSSKPGHPHYDDHYTIWDTFRSLFPLYTLMAPDRMPGLINGLLDAYDATGWIPDAWISQGHGAVQGGSNADVVIADAIVKGVKGFDYERAYAAIRKNATVNAEDPANYGRYLAPYLKHGYVPANIRNSGSRTIEYAYNDFCIAQTARLLGKQADYQLFLRQSQNAFNLFNPEWKHFWVKDEKGAWLPGFTPGYLANPIWEGPFYEGSPAHYSVCATPHNFARLAELHGGTKQFEAYLDQYFEGGMHWHGNEPGFLAAYAYHYAGRPDKAAEQVRKIMQTDYRLEASGMPGDEDAGAMSSWYIFGALGFYPVAGQDVYLVGSPHFEEATLWMGEGKNLVIRAENLSETNVHVQEVRLNGQPLSRAWFRHNEIASGGELLFIMGEKPSEWGRSELPPSPGYVKEAPKKGGKRTK